MKKLLWQISGANVSLLEKSTGTDKMRYSTIGIALLTSTMVAVMSMYYAAYIVSNNFIVGSIFGIMFGIFYFSINRNLIIAINDYKKSILPLFFRIIILLLLAITTTFPLQLSIFGDSIKQELEIQRLEHINYIENQYDTTINAIRDNIQGYRELLIKEIAGIQETTKYGSSSGIPGYSVRTKEIEKIITAYEIELYKTHQERDKVLLETREILSTQSNSFIEQLEAYFKVLKRNRIVLFASLLLFLVIFLTEIFPIVVIFLTKKGLYEELLKVEEEHRFRFVRNRLERDLYNALNEISNEQIETTSETETRTQTTSDNNTFHNYCISIISSLEQVIYQNNIKAKELLRTGLLIILLGMLAYIGYGLFLFVIYFETHKFENHHIFLFSSISVVFFFVQFIGGWYLKEYRNTHNDSLIYTNLKEKYDRYILSDLLKNDSKEKDICSLAIINGLLNNKDSIFDKIQDVKNENFAKEVFDSINKLKDLINAKI